MFGPWRPDSQLLRCFFFKRQSHFTQITLGLDHHQGSGFGFGDHRAFAGHAHWLGFGRDAGLNGCNFGGIRVHPIQTRILCHLGQFGHRQCKRLELGHAACGGRGGNLCCHGRLRCCHHLNRCGCLNRRLNGYWCSDHCRRNRLGDGRSNGCRWRCRCCRRWCGAAGYGSCCFRGKVRLAGLTLGFLLGSRCFTHWALLTLALLSAVTARCAFAAIAVT